MAKSMILPYLDYGIVFMSSSRESALQRLQRLQNKILKSALSLSRLTGTCLVHKTARVLMIRDKIRYNQLVLIHHEILNNSTLFSMSVDSNARTRSSVSTQLVLNRPNIEHFCKSLYYYGLNEWNNLPLDLRTCTTLTSFKHKLKAIILS